MSALLTISMSLSIASRKRMSGLTEEAKIGFFGRPVPQRTATTRKLRPVLLAHLAQFSADRAEVRVDHVDQRPLRRLVVQHVCRHHALDEDRESPVWGVQRTELLKKSSAVQARFRNT
ncbi:hypothetical protein ORI60_11450 [Lentzea sp. NEAU-D7]|nr:hypothetical protein [Lentzea sp. NEAU-D7]MCX2948947.1 hypothetical protein [Lentzea sp. NEAU-D7]